MVSGSYAQVFFLNDSLTGITQKSFKMWSGNLCHLLSIVRRVKKSPFPP